MAAAPKTPYMDSVTIHKYVLTFIALLLLQLQATNTYNSQFMYGDFWGVIRQQLVC